LFSGCSCGMLATLLFLVSSTRSRNGVIKSVLFRLLRGSFFSLLLFDGAPRLLALTLKLCLTLTEFLLALPRF